MNTRMNFSFYNPTRILFGAGELNTLYKQTMPGKKALLLISMVSRPRSTVRSTARLNNWKRPA